MNSFTLGLQEQNSTDQQRAVGAYKQAGHAKAMSGFEIAAELYKAILKNMNDAKRAYQSNDLEEVVAINSNTFDILAELQARLNLDDEDAADTAQFLYRFYNIIFVKTMRVLTVDDTEAAYDELISYIKPVYSRWQALADGDTDADDNAT